MEPITMCTKTFLWSKSHPCMGITVLSPGFDNMFEFISHFTCVCHACHAMCATCLILLPGLFHPHQSPATEAQKTTSESIKKLISEWSKWKNKKGKIFSTCYKCILGNGGTAPCILNLCNRWRPTYPLGKTPDTHLTGGCVSHGSDLCTLEMREMSCLCQKLNDFLVILPVAKALYWLSYINS